MTAKARYAPSDAMIYPRFAGIRTFMRLPHVTDVEDVGFCIVGVPFDTGATYRVGTRFGPEGIRNSSLLLRPFNPSLVGLRPGRDCAGLRSGGHHKPAGSQQMYEFMSMTALARQNATVDSWT